MSACLFQDCHEENVSGPHLYFRPSMLEIRRNGSKKLVLSACTRPFWVLCSPGNNMYVNNLTQFLHLAPSPGWISSFNQRRGCEMPLGKRARYSLRPCNHHAGRRNLLWMKLGHHWLLLHGLASWPTLQCKSLVSQGEPNRVYEIVLICLRGYVALDSRQVIL